MPRIPKGQEYKPEKRLENAFVPMNEEALAGKNPYFQINTGCFLKEFAVGEEIFKDALFSLFGHLSFGVVPDASGSRQYEE